jgi:hypothetical protein
MIAQVTIIILFFVMPVRRFRYRGLPRIGGKLGPIRTSALPQPRPNFFGLVEEHSTFFKKRDFGTDHSVGV